MTYLLTQLWLYLLIAGLIGSVLGWLLRGSCKRYTQAIEEMQIRYSALQKENNSNKKKNAVLSKLSYQKNSLLAEVKRLEHVKQHNKKLSAQLVKMQHGIRKARSIYEQTNQKLGKAQELLAFAKQSNHEKDANIKQIKKEAIVTDNSLLKSQAEWTEKYRALKAQHKIEVQENEVKGSEIIQTKLHEAESMLVEKDSELNALSAKLGDLEGENSTLGEVQAKLAEAESELAVKELFAEKLTIQAAEFKEQKSSAFSHLDLFKKQSKEYITKITEENAKYKVGVELLKGDAQQWLERHEQKEYELDQTKLSLQEKDQEIVALKEQLKSKLVKVVSEADNELGSKKNHVQKQINTLIVPKLNLLSNKIKVVSRQELEQSKSSPNEAIEKVNTLSTSIPLVHAIDVIYGVGKAYAERLGEQGISTTEDLLLYLQENGIQDENEAGIDETQVSKEALAEKLAMAINVETSEIKSWAIMADLLRLEGVSNEYAKSLELSEISSVEDLANSKVSEVSMKMIETMQNERRIKRAPDGEEISTWIIQSRLMEPAHASSEAKQEVAKPVGLHIFNLSKSSKPTSWRSVKKFVKKHRRR